MQPWTSYIDQWLFIKKGYSLWMHLIPFAVASLLLVVLSVPKDNALISLTVLLGKPSWLWIPAAVLIVVTGGMYLVSLRAEIARADCFPTHVWRRTLITGGLFLILCTGLAYGVLRTVSQPHFIAQDMSACLMVAALSLAGIGWKGPEGWSESVHLKMPDYEACHDSEIQISRKIEALRQPGRAKAELFQQFTDQLCALRKGIEANVPLEPAWNYSRVASITELLLRLEIQIGNDFGAKPDSIRLRTFSDVCRGDRSFEYPDLLEAFEQVGQYWPDWRFPKRNSQ